MSAMFALAIKDVRLLVRDKGGLIFTFVFPVLYATFFGLVFKGVGKEIGGAIDVVVVDEDQTPASRALAELLADKTRTRELNAEIATRAGAIELVRRGKKVAFILIPPGFQEAEDNRFAGALPRLEVGADPARAAEAGMLRGVLFKIMGQRLQHSFMNPGQIRGQIARSRERVEADPNAAGAMGGMLLPFFGALDLFLGQLESRSATDADASDGAAAQSAFRGFEPAEIVAVDVELRRHGPRNAFAVSFPQGIIWGVMGAAAGFGISLVVERTQGTLMRLRLTPVSLAHILAGKALACFATIVAVCLGMLLFAIAVFNVRPESPGLIPLAVLAVALGFSGIMMLLASLGRTEQAVSGMAWALLSIMAMIGGGMVPVFFMPEWMQTLSSISPVKWAILCFEGVLWRQFSLAEMLRPSLILTAIGLGCFTLGVAVFSRSARA